MAPVTVTFNGRHAVGQVVEEPDAALSVIEYAEQLAAAHDVPGTEFVFTDGGAEVDPAESVEVLEGRSVFLSPRTPEVATPVSDLLGEPADESAGDAPAPETAKPKRGGRRRKDEPAADAPEVTG